MSTSRQMRRAFRCQLDASSGVPIYRQIIDQITGGLASGGLVAGDQLPTVRQLAVDLSVNPNTVIRAYRELEIRGILETQQGTGTFVSNHQLNGERTERARLLNQLVADFVGRAGAAGFTLEDLLDQIEALRRDAGKRRR